MYQALLDALAQRPAPYEPTPGAFWDDEHISASMLRNHLDPEGEGATRNHAFLDRSARWIAGLCPAGGTLLDLGCGPGLYAERFCDLGLRVTGVDLSRRSIRYAQGSAAASGRSIAYRCMDYQALEDDGVFDLACIIYCDFGVLNPSSRADLLARVRRALRPGGRFVLDAFAPANYAAFAEGLTANREDGGFWSAEPYLTLLDRRAYPDRVYLERHTVVTAAELHSYNLWNHAFLPEELEADLRAAGFGSVALYGDAAGAPLTPEIPTLCAVAQPD